LKLLLVLEKNLAELIEGMLVDVAAKYGKMAMNMKWQTENAKLNAKKLKLKLQSLHKA